MKQVVEEAILGVPHLIVVVSDSIHRVCDPQELLNEPERNLFVIRVELRQDERNLKHVLAIESHPRCTVRLVKMAASRQFGAAVEYSDVVEPEEASREDVSTLWIFSIDPPIEVCHQALKGSFKETNIGAAQFPFNVE